MKHWDKYIGGSIESDLEAFDVSKLDAFEQMQYSDLIKHSTKVEALKILINNVEGDFSQLSPNLNDIAEMYYPVEDNYFMDDDIRYADGGGVTKREERQNFIDEYLKENEPIENEKLKKFYIKEATREYNKKILSQTPQRYYNVTFQIPAGKISTYRMKGKSGRDAFSKYVGVNIDITGGKIKFISAVLSSNQKDKKQNGGDIRFGGGGNVENKETYKKWDNYKNGGGVKTDFNDLNNIGLRKALISFREDFNTFLSNYLQVGKENYILSNIDNVMVIFRDKSLGDFSDVENVSINKWIQPYFDIRKKPLIAEYLNGYKIDGNKIIIDIQDSQMYANGGGVEYRSYVNNIYRNQSEQPARDGLMRFASEQGFEISDVENALQVYKYDTEENAWGENYYTKVAIAKMVDMISGKKYADGGSTTQYANGGGVSDLQFTSKTLTKSKESKLKEKLFDGRISEVDLKNIIGFEPNYPTQIVGTIKLEKCFLLPYYKIK